MSRKALEPPPAAQELSEGGGRGIAWYYVAGVGEISEKGSSSWLSPTHDPVIPSRGSHLKCAESRCVRRSFLRIFSDKRLPRSRRTLRA